MAVNYPIRWWVFTNNSAFTGWYWILVLSISTCKCNETFIKYLLLANNLLGNNVNAVIFYDGYCYNAVSPKGTCIVNAYCQFSQQACTNFMQTYLYSLISTHFFILTTNLHWGMRMHFFRFFFSGGMESASILQVIF